MDNLEYSFIRSEKDSSITLFIQGDSSWLEQEIDISLTNPHELMVKVGLKEFIAKNLSPLLSSSLSNQATVVILCDREANFLGHATLELGLNNNLESYINSNKDFLE